MGSVYIQESKINTPKVYTKVIFSERMLLLIFIIVLMLGYLIAKGGDVYKRSGTWDNYHFIYIDYRTLFVDTLEQKMKILID